MSQPDSISKPGAAKNDVKRFSFVFIAPAEETYSTMPLQGGEMSPGAEGTVRLAADA